MAQGTSSHAVRYGHPFLAEEEPQLSDRQIKRLPLLRALLTLLFGFVVLATATAQTSTDPNEGSRLTYDSELGSYDLSWWASRAAPISSTNRRIYRPGSICLSLNPAPTM